MDRLLGMDLSLTALRVFRAVAERGSFTAAAAATGYTQSAVSRQIASLETATGRALVERRPDGVRLTDAGRTLLHRAARALDELEAAGRELSGAPPKPRLRLGAIPSAGAWLVPRVVAAVRDVDLVTTSGSSRTLIKALRAGSIDLAVVARTPPFRPFDEEAPPLAARLIAEHELLVAVPASSNLASSRFGGVVPVEELAGEAWIGSGRSAEESGLGVWPGLPGRPRVMHSSTDWLAKLQLVAAGAGLTSIPTLLVPVLPPAVRAVRVTGGSRELRQLFVARRPDDQPPGDQPPDDRPPGDRPPDDRPPDDRPPGNQPPGHQPPGHQPTGAALVVEEALATVARELLVVPDQYLGSDPR